MSASVRSVHHEPEAQPDRSAPRRSAHGRILTHGAARHPGPRLRTAIGRNPPPTAAPPGDQHMAASSLMVPLGTPAHDFELPSFDGTTVKLADLDGRALLVMFLCNHCPYVRHVERRRGEVVADYAARDLAVVAINSNALDAYPEDGPAGMAEQARRAGCGFPYLLDEGRQVAADYRAMCTPDLFVYDADRRLAYRGAFDGSTPRN